MSDEKISQAERDQAADFASRAAASLGGEARPLSGMADSASSDESPTLFDVQEMELNFGPQHPSTHGVLRIILKVDGEKILEAKPDVGYLHRGVEKIAEHRTYTMFNPYVDRMDYVAAVSNGLGYCEAVEKLLNVDAPPRARYIRVILTELNRLEVHVRHVQHILNHKGGPDES